MKLKFINTAVAGLILSISCIANFANAGVIGSLSHTTGDAFVTDSLNDLEWMHFDAIGNNGTVESLLASFSDINSELYGFTLAGTTHADLFLDAAFGTQDYSTTSAGYINMLTGIDSSAFLETMGDGFGNNNNVWKSFASDDVIAGSINLDWTLGQTSNSTNLNHTGNVSTNPDSWVNDMAWLAYRPSDSNVVTPPVVPVPEPTTLAVFALALIGFASRKVNKQS